MTIARADLGYRESPAGSNKTKFGKRMGLDGQPWCMSAVQCWCMDAGVALPLKTASCGALMRAAQKAGQWVTKNYRPGDIAIYNFPGGGETDHTGIVESVTASGITAIEGNTGYGNDANGGEVLRRNRPFSSIRGAVRPKYESEAKTMDNTPKISAEAVAWAQENKILQGNKEGDLLLSQPCTREMMATFLYRYHQKYGK